MWLTSKRPARVRTAMCSWTMPEYSTGMSHPPNDTILAPEARWRALSGVFLRGASVACSIERRVDDAGTGNGTMRFRARSRIVARSSHDDVVEPHGVRTTHGCGIRQANEQRIDGRPRLAAGDGREVAERVALAAGNDIDRRRFGDSRKHIWDRRRARIQVDRLELECCAAGGDAHLAVGRDASRRRRSEEHTSELQSLTNLVCRLLLEKKKKRKYNCKIV